MFDQSNNDTVSLNLYNSQQLNKLKFTNTFDDMGSVKQNNDLQDKLKQTKRQSCIIVIYIYLYV